MLTALGRTSKNPRSRSCSPLLNKANGHLRTMGDGTPCCPLVTAIVQWVAANIVR